MRLRLSLIIALPLVFSALAEAKDPVPNSVVKIYVTRREPDFYRPWNKANPEEASGSGVVIEGKRILTNAHVVLYASQIFVQADQSTDRLPAKMTVIAPGIDLALVELEKPAFFDDHPPLPLADGIAALKQAVNVYGYPIGGEQMSITQGIVSRIECTTIYCLVRGLRIQIDAALNPGNSGGPAVADGKIVGLVHSKFSKGENIGYLIAADEIRMFLKDVQAGAYHGKPQLWDHLESTENEALRAKLGLDKAKQTGVLVSHPFRSTDDYPLKKWDVITRIGDHPVDSQGDVKVRDDLRLQFQYLRSQVGERRPRVADDFPRWQAQRRAGSGSSGWRLRHALSHGEVPSLLHLWAAGFHTGEPKSGARYGWGSGAPGCRSC